MDGIIMDWNGCMDGIVMHWIGMDGWMGLLSMDDIK